MAMAHGKRSIHHDGLGRYYTDPRLARAIVNQFPFTGQEVILEPSAGGGAFIGALHRLNGVGFANSLYACDIDEDAPVLQVETPHFRSRCCDFLDPVALDGWPQPDTVIMNPPYSIRVPVFKRGQPVYVTNKDGVRVQKTKSVEVGTDHVLRALEVTRRHVIALMPSQFASGVERYDRLWSKFNCRTIWQIVGRPSFTGGGTSSNDYSVFHFDLAYDGKTQHKWLAGWDK